MERICGHCLQPMHGYAKAGVWLCHPDEGADCYHLVTVYGHPTPCPQCPGQVGMMTIAQALDLDLGP